MNAKVMLALFCTLLGACAMQDGDDASGSEAAATKIKGVTKADREKYIANAQVWSEPNGEKDLLAGPGGDGSFQAVRGESGPTFPSIQCTFVEPKREHELGGKSPKFQCNDGTRTLKVKYGKDADANGELYGEVIATRLFWALGFPTDDVYPVVVTCANCPEDPWDVYDNFKPGQGKRATRVYAAAVIERKYDGPKIEEASWPSDGDSEGFGFDEADKIRAAHPGEGAPEAQWQAFRLLAAFIKHADNKPANQRLACTSDGAKDDGTCSAPIMMMQDVGATFGGGAGIFGIIGDGTKARLKEWRDSPVWKNHDKCQAQLSSRFTLSDPRVTEQGRAFLVSRLETLTDEQLRDIVTTSRITERGETIDGQKVTVDDWIATFRAKQADLSKPCP